MNKNIDLVIYSTVVKVSVERLMDGVLRGGEAGERMAIYRGCI